MLWPVLAFASIIGIVILSAIIVSIKKQLNKLSSMMNYIMENDTNMQLYTEIKLKELNHLTQQINLLISHYKNESTVYRQIVQEFKETVINLSHDLRTPITSASGYIQMLKADNVPADKRGKYLDIIDTRITALRELIDQLFEFSKLQSNEYVMQMERLEVVGILCDTLSQYYDDFLVKGITPQIEIVDRKVFIQADKDALVRIFENLISNTIKYSEGDFHVTLLVEDGRVKITFANITDTISKDDVKLLFHRYFTQDKSRNGQNNGLGLSIAKEFIKKMSGDVNAQLKEGVLEIIMTFAAL